MTPNEFVKLYMQNCQYRNEVSLMAAAVAEENGLVVVFGASDDLCEIRGAEDDEIDCFDGGEATIAGAKVKINWCKDGYSWTYDTDIPHECFDVYEDGEKYCRGIVFSISDVRLLAADVAPVRHGYIIWKRRRRGGFRHVKCLHRFCNFVIEDNAPCKHIAKIDERYTTDEPYCSECGKLLGDFLNYCGNCGARMDGDNNERP